MPERPDKDRIDAVLNAIKESYPGKLLLSKRETAHVLGMSERTFYNLSRPGAENRFPIKPVKAGGLKYRIHDIADHIARL